MLNMFKYLWKVVSVVWFANGVLSEEHQLRDSGSSGVNRTKREPPVNFSPPSLNAPISARFEPNQSGVPKPQYGPPKHQYGPPKYQYGPPKPQYGPPQVYGSPKPQYGPPKTQYGVPQVYAPPKQQYGVPQVYGSPKPQYGVPQVYGPPKTQYSPPQTQYGPPQTQYGPPQTQYGPPQTQYGPPQTQYGPPQTQYNPPQTQYGPPQTQYGPPQTQYGPPQTQYGPPQTQYGPPQTQYGPPKTQYGVPAVYGVPKQVYGVAKPYYATLKPMYKQPTLYGYPRPYYDQVPVVSTYRSYFYEPPSANYGYRSIYPRTVPPALYSTPTYSSLQPFFMPPPQPQFADQSSEEVRDVSYGDFNDDTKPVTFGTGQPAALTGPPNFTPYSPERYYDSFRFSSYGQEEEPIPTMVYDGLPPTYDTPGAVTSYGTPTYYVTPMPLQNNVEVQSAFSNVNVEYVKNPSVSSEVRDKSNKVKM